MIPREKEEPSFSRPAEERGRSGIPEPPHGWRRLLWLGPGFLWMVSATGSGELLFTPRVAALYGYALLWGLLAAVLLKWFINREVGRFAVCTGVSLLDGFSKLPGPRNWAVWLILGPQLLVAVTTVAGLASAAATALILILPGEIRLWTAGLISLSGFLVLKGHYRIIERIATAVAILLAVLVLTAALMLFPDPAAVADGLIPRLPANVDYGEVLPWLGFMLSGAAGFLWYSFWIPQKGYGAAGSRRTDAGEAVDPTPAGRQRLRGWLTQMTLDNTVGVIGALVIAIAFLILGAELLKPRGLVPDEDRVAATLGHLLGGVWGPTGYWFMIAGVLIGFWGTVLSVQDGFSRLLGTGTRLLVAPLHPGGRWEDEAFWRRLYLIGWVTLFPIVLFFFVGKPVGLLKLAGGIEAAHIPIVAGLTLYLNRRRLPPELQPSRPAFLATTLAALFFAGFALVYLWSLFTPKG